MAVLVLVRLSTGVEHWIALATDQQADETQKPCCLSPWFFYLRPSSTSSQSQQTILNISPSSFSSSSISVTLVATYNTETRTIIPCQGARDERSLIASPPFPTFTLPPPVWFFDNMPPKKMYKFRNVLPNELLGEALKHGKRSRDTATDETAVNALAAMPILLRRFREAVRRSSQTVQDAVDSKTFGNSLLQQATKNKEKNEEFRRLVRDSLKAYREGLVGLQETMTTCNRFLHRKRVQEFETQLTSHPSRGGETSLSSNTEVTETFTNLKQKYFEMELLAATCMSNSCQALLMQAEDVPQSNSDKIALWKRVNRFALRAIPLASSSLKQKLYFRNGKALLALAVTEGSAADAVEAFREAGKLSAELGDVAARDEAERMRIIAEEQVQLDRAREKKVYAKMF